MIVIESPQVSLSKAKDEPRQLKILQYWSHFAVLSFWLCLYKNLLLT